MSENENVAPNMAAIMALRDGMLLKVEPDPEDERFTLVTFRRPRTPVEVDREYKGMAASGKFLKMAAASLQGSGLGDIIEHEGATLLVVDMGALLTLSEGRQDAEGPN